MGYEWYTLDDSLRKSEMVQGFESFIWTERYSAAGDFQIVTRSTSAARRFFVPDTFVGKNDSTYTMKIDTITDEEDGAGNQNLTIKGLAMENLFNDRVGYGAATDTTTTPNWTLAGTPGDVIRQMVQQVCVTGVLDPKDTIPFYHAGTLLPAGNIPEPSDIITVVASLDYLYNSVKSVADAYNLGFRLVRDGDNSAVYFEVYTGSDRTTDQSTLPAVIFSPDMESLSQISQLKSTALIKTVAYVYAANGFQVVNAPLADSTATADKRRILLVNSNNQDPAGAGLDAALQQEGLLALASQQPIYAFDGVLPQSLPYVYGKDYNLGDLVTEQASDGYGNQMRVTEQIFVSDDQGERAYPTLSVNQVITPGSWTSEGALTWSTINPALTWSTA